MSWTVSSCVPPLACCVLASSPLALSQIPALASGGKCSKHSHVFPLAVRQADGGAVVELLRDLARQGRLLLCYYMNLLLCYRIKVEKYDSIAL